MSLSVKQLFVLGLLAVVLGLFIYKGKNTNRVETEPSWGLQLSGEGDSVRYEQICGLVLDSTFWDFGNKRILHYYHVGPVKFMVTFYDLTSRDDYRDWLRILESVLGSDASAR